MTANTPPSELVGWLRELANSQPRGDAGMLDYAADTIAALLRERDVATYSFAIIVNEMGESRAAAESRAEKLELERDAQAKVIAQLEVERDEARYRPMGDNHHNANKCPYCRAGLNTQVSGNG